MADAERFNWRLTLVLWSILLAGSMWLMLTTAAHKTIVIADTGQEQGRIEESTEPARRVGKLLLRENAQEKDTFYIPLGKGERAENVVVENRYSEGELRIYIKGADADFYENQEVGGDLSHLVSAYWESQKGGVLLRLKMNGIYEYQNSMEEQRLKISTLAPHELYRMVVVVDPTGGGKDPGRTAGGHSEQEIALALTRQLQSQMKNTNIRLYFTRVEDTEVSAEIRAALAQAVEADLFINIGVSVDEDAEKYGIQGQYNEAYFIPGFGNVQLADILVRNVTIAGKNRAVGLNAAEQDSILRQFRIPAARLEVGYLTNTKERELLLQEEYLQKLAEGIAKAIEEVYESYYE